MKRIIGCGNLLLRDEGVGVHLIEFLKGEDLPVDVELVDGATGGFDLISFIEGCQKVIIVDAVKGGGSPGDIYKFTPADFETESSPKTSFHDITLKEIFHIIEMTGKLPHIVIFGIEPAVIDWGMELTDKIKAILPRLGELVIKEIKDA